MQTLRWHWSRSPWPFQKPPSIVGGFADVSGKDRRLARKAFFTWVRSNPADPCAEKAPDFTVAMILPVHSSSDLYVTRNSAVLILQCSRDPAIPTIVRSRLRP